jgi:predicted metal-dependent hydrolase
MHLDWAHGELAAGLRSFDAGEFFLAHEHWESVWLHAPEPQKTFLQALIQLAAAYYQSQRGNERGTITLLRSALGRLEGYPPAFEGVAVARLRDDLRVTLTTLETREPSASPSELPRIPIALV